MDGPSRADLEAHVKRCGSNLCLADDISRESMIWFSFEPVCGARGLMGDLRRAQRAMRKLARVRTPGYFDLRDLVGLRRVSRRTRGFDPDAPFDVRRRLSMRKAEAWRKEEADAAPVPRNDRRTNPPGNPPVLTRGEAVPEGPG